MLKTIALFSLLMLLAACNTTTPEPIQEPTLTLVPSSTPPADGQITTYEDIPTGTTAEGYPTLGSDDAPVILTEYGSYDSSASRLSHEDIFSQLIPRIAAGEVQYVFIPLSGTGTIPNGTGAARGALCAGQQGAYWAYHDRLYAQQQIGADAFNGANLLDIADELGLDRDVWNACVLGESPNNVLRRASEDALELESYAGTPTILINGSYVLNELFSINEIIDQIIEQVDESGEVAALPSPEVQPTATPDLELSSTIEQAVDAPLEIALPEGWEMTLNDTLLLNDIDAIRTVPFTLWKGPVEGGTGSIVMLWGFPNITSGNPLEAQMGVATITPNLRIDGSRLLRLAVVEQGCNVGTDLERGYRVGQLQGIGTEWSAVDCPELPDTRGWFVGVQHEGINFLFYAFVEPINPSGITDAERQARDQLQTILDSVNFLPIESMPTPPPIQVTATP